MIDMNINHMNVKAECSGAASTIGAKSIAGIASLVKILASATDLSIEAAFLFAMQSVSEGLKRFDESNL